MGAYEMEEMRRKVAIPQGERLTILVSAGSNLHMVCSLCDSPLTWLPEKKWWECECGLETTPSEARLLMEDARGTLDTYVEALGGKRLRSRSFKEWLANLFGLRPPSLPPET